MLLIAALALIACRSGDEDDRPEWHGPRVIVLVMDGVRDEESFGDGTSDVTGGPPDTLMPSTWAALVPQGARATRVLNAGITTTGPSHATLLVGARQTLGNYDVIDEVGLYRTELPTLFEAARRQLDLSRQQLTLMGNVSLIQPVTHSRSPACGSTQRAWFGLVGESAEDLEPERGGSDDRVVFERLKQNLERRAPVLSVVNLHQVDRATHGAGEDVYAQHLSILDQELPVFWEWVQAQPELADDTWLFVVSDHGRHDRAETDPSWQTHGDSCTGCRGVPWLVLGPGVDSGAVHDTLLLEDVAPTVAAILGVALPWAEGVPATGLTGVSGPERSGPSELAASGTALVEAWFTGDHDHRSEVLLDGVRISASAALLAGGVSVLQDGEHTWACHRSLRADPLDGALPWEPWCGLASAGVWTDLALPVAEVAPHWLPSLVADEQGGVAVVTVHDPEGATVPGHEGDEGLRVLHWQDGSWVQHDKPLRVSFPTDPSAVWVDAGLVVVFAAGDPGRDSRHSRRLYQAVLDPESGAWDDLTQLDLAPEGASDWRLERPVLGTDGDAIVLAAVAHTAGEMHLVRARSTDGGASWETLPEPVLSAQVLPHVTPVQDGDETWFAALDVGEGAALVCVVGADDTAHCRDAGSTRIRDLALSHAGVEVLVDTGVGAWQRLTLPR